MRLNKVLICPFCGKEARASKKQVRAKSGKLYYYIRFYHDSSEIHYIHTDSSYSSISDIKKRSGSLRSALEDYISNEMEPVGYTFTSLKKEVEEYFGEVVNNEEFSRSLKGAISVGLLERRIEIIKPLYSKILEIGPKKMVGIIQASITYDFSDKSIHTTTFLEVINRSQVPIEKISHFIPFGPIESLDRLHLRVYDETGEILIRKQNIVVNAALKFIFSIPLNRLLRNGDRNFIFLSYEMPNSDYSADILALDSIDLLKITIVTSKGYRAKVIRTLIGGVRQSEIPLLKGIPYHDHLTLSQSQLEGISRGERISVKLTTNQIV